ncbi:MAG: LamG domain-containing protein [Chitinophagaceae bacterium]|jgi:hypothetical protein|nr:LamG domain-containing protein [Chitinophagaceae bacterium]
MKCTVLFIALALFLFSCSKDENPVTPADPNASLKEGLVAYYPFNGNANDESGNNLHGSIVGSVTFSDNRYFEGGKAAFFPGAANYINVPDNSKLQLKEKMSIYVEFLPLEESAAMLVGKRNYGTGQQAWGLSINYNTPAQFSVIKEGRCSDNNSTSDWSYGFSDNSETVKIGCWNYLVAVFDGGTQTIYLNGKRVLNQPGSGFTQMAGCTGTDIRFGTWWSGDQVSFRGKLDEIRIYNRVLSDSEIRRLYKFDGTGS